VTPEEQEEWQKMWDNHETIYLSREDFDYLQDKLNEPPNPQTIASLKKLLERTSPWQSDQTMNQK